MRLDWTTWVVMAASLLLILILMVLVLFPG
jgi:hypothetical protein